MDEQQAHQEPAAHSGGDVGNKLKRTEACLLVLLHLAHGLVLYGLVFSLLYLQGCMCCTQLACIHAATAAAPACTGLVEGITSMGHAASTSSQPQPWPHLNWPNEKSEAITAALPSRPLMPQPMCAAWIMLTSLAPSPMPSVTAPAFFFTSLVTCRG